MKAKLLTFFFSAALMTGCDDLRDSAQRHTDPVGYQQNRDSAYSSRVAGVFNLHGFDTINSTSNKISTMDRMGNSRIEQGYFLKKSDDTTAVPQKFYGSYVEVLSGKTVLSKGALNFSRVD